MPLGICTVARNCARCSTLSCHNVTNVVLHVLSSVPVAQCHVEDALANSTDLCFCNLYLKHFSLLASPLRCITGALLQSRVLPCSCAPSVSHWVLRLTRASCCGAFVESGCSRVRCLSPSRCRLNGGVDTWVSLVPSTWVVVEACWGCESGPWSVGLIVGTWSCSVSWVLDTEESNAS